MEKVYIVGAHSRGRTLKAYLEYLQEAETEAFLVDELAGNPDAVDGVPVRLIGAGLDTDKKVYIATRGISHGKLTEELKAVGMKRIIPVTVELDSAEEDSKDICGAFRIRCAAEDRIRVWEGRGCSSGRRCPYG